jgi:hypothetical protein
LPGSEKIDESLMYAYVGRNALLRTEKDLQEIKLERPREETGFYRERERERWRVIDF